MKTHPIDYPILMTSEQAKMLERIATEYQTDTTTIINEIVRNALQRRIDGVPRDIQDGLGLAPSVDGE